LTEEPVEVGVVDLQDARLSAGIKPQTHLACVMVAHLLDLRVVFLSYGPGL